MAILTFVILGTMTHPHFSAFPDHASSFKDKDGTISPRKIGVEIEYLGVTLEDSAALIQSLYKGELQRKHRQKHTIETESLGRFAVELDVELLQKMAEDIETTEEQDSSVQLQVQMHDMLAPVVSHFAPCEIIAPPLTLKNLEKLEALIERLREAGAQGTGTSMTHAFGLHINVEPPSLEASTLLSYLQSFALLYDWLEERMQMDISRKLTFFTRPYPDAYVRHILQPDYKPDINKLIEDYLYYNPTRNKALDMLPLFAWIDEARVKQAVPDSLVRKRPTFHFRMPNCRIDEPNWSLRQEWEHWMVIEKLADDPILRHKMAEAYLTHDRDWLALFKDSWKTQTAALLSDVV